MIEDCPSRVSTKASSSGASVSPSNMMVGVLSSMIAETFDFGLIAEAKAETTMMSNCSDRRIPSASENMLHTAS